MINYLGIAKTIGGSKVKGLLAATAVLLAGCSSIEKGKLSSSRPSEAIEEVREFVEKGREGHIDLLAKKQFRLGEKKFEDAARSYNRGAPSDEILENLAVAKGLLLEAANVAASRTEKPERVVLDARTAALRSGLQEEQSLVEKLDKIDQSVLFKTNNFKEVLAVSDQSDFEQSYLKLEIDAVQNRHLSSSREILAIAEKEGAKKLAPSTYRKAASSVRAAENMIQQGARNPENFRESVLSAERSAKLLRDVMEKLTGIASGASEDAALKLVYQERSLETKTGEALVSGNKVRLQKAMDDMRKLFPSEEAEVYQKGSDLIIRLKKINFGVGSAMVPSESMDLLAKVNSVIMRLQSPEVLVEGHTDSTGSELTNKNLSVMRSKAVAQYLESLGNRYEISSAGFGASRPIANNQTREGRTMNRRVDIVVKTVR